MGNTNRPSVKTRNTGVMAGIDKHITTSETIGGAPHTPASLKAVFAAQTAALDAADAQHQQWKDQVQVARAASKTANGVYQSLRSFLVGKYGNEANAILNDFGMTAPKAKGAKTVATKSAGVAKRAATRTARHTMGKKQRKQVHGTATAAATGTAPAGPAPTSPAASKT